MKSIFILHADLGFSGTRNKSSSNKHNPNILCRPCHCGLSAQQRVCKWLLWTWQEVEDAALTKNRELRFLTHFITTISVAYERNLLCFAAFQTFQHSHFSPDGETHDEKTLLPKETPPGLNKIAILLTLIFSIKKQKNN